MCNRLTKLSVTMWYTFFGIFDDTSLWILPKTHDPSLCDTPDDMWCDQAKWVWSRKVWILVFWNFLLGYCLGVNFVKTSQRLGNWFQRYKQLKDWTSNKKQKKLLALFGCILKTVFVSSDSFCLITSHVIIGEARGCGVKGEKWK